MSNSNIGVEVIRDPASIINSLMEYRNQKVDMDIDIPLEYKVETTISDEDPENAFYRFFSNSTIQMVPGSPSYIPEPEEVAKLIGHTSNTDTYIEAKPKNITKHEPVLRDAVYALKEEGYGSRTVLEGLSDGVTVQKALENLEKNGVRTLILIEEAPFDSYFKEVQGYLCYNAEGELFHPELGDKRNFDNSGKTVDDAIKELENLIEDYDM